MTLVLIAGNNEFVVQVSDRRLTAGGKVVAEEATKMIYIETPVSQLVLGYTGVANVGGRPMNEILLQMLEDRALPNAPRDPLEAARELARELNEFFANGPGRRLALKDRLLTIAITGFFMTTGGWVGPVQWLITNFQEWGVMDHGKAWPVFTIHFSDPIPGLPAAELTLVERIGQWPTTTQEDAEKVRLLLAPGKPPIAARDKMVEMIEERSKAEPTIGAQMNSVILERGKPPVWSYHTAIPTSTVYLGDAIGVDDNGNVVKSVNASFVRTDGIAVVPTVHRSAPCPCGSGLAYGRCHGKRRST